MGTIPQLSKYTRDLIYGLLGQNESISTITVAWAFEESGFDSRLGKEISFFTFSRLDLGSPVLLSNG
jgi:hypothetical protein